MVLKNDNFNDNSRDTSFWDIYAVGGGSVAETNQQLECTCASSEDASGYVTVNAHDLTSCDISIDTNFANNQLIGFLLGLEKSTNTFWPHDNGYTVFLRKDTSTLEIYRRVDDGHTELYNESWAGAIETLRIKIESGTIYFYEAGIERVNESYAHASYNCYVYILCRAYATATGTDSLDNFLGTSGVAAKPVSGGSIAGMMQSMMAQRILWRPKSLTLPKFVPRTVI